MKEDLTGRTFGQWTVLRREPHPTRSEVYWLCRCACGDEYQVRGTDLRSGRSTRCQLCQRRAATEARKGVPLIDMKGQVFGKWEVLRFARMQGDRSMWLCVCDCGSLREVDGVALRQGSSTQCSSCGRRAGWKTRRTAR